MAIPKGKLVQADVDTLPAGVHGDGHGLYLQITPPNGKSWLYRYQLANQKRWIGIGPAHTITLAHARQIAMRLRARVRGDRIDVLLERRQQEQARSGAVETFRKVAETYVAGQDHRRRHARQWEQTLQDYAYPHIGDMPVSSVSRADLLKLLTPIWAAKSQTARKLRARIERIFDYAVAHGMRPDNPALLGPLEAGLPKQRTSVNHRASLPYHDIADFIRKLRAHQGVVPIACEFMILTASRPNETLSARWSEIDRVRGVWAVPAERMKAGREHVVPLSAGALAVLDRVAPQSEYIFPNPNGGQLSDGAMLRLFQRMGYHVVPHGMRSTFRTWAQDATDFDPSLAEAALAHVVGDKTVQAYARGTMLGRRRELMTAWATHCGV
jgi:integrase